MPSLSLLKMNEPGFSFNDNPAVGGESSLYLARQAMFDDVLIKPAASAAPQSPSLAAHELMTLDMLDFAKGSHGGGQGGGSGGSGGGGTDPQTLGSYTSGAAGGYNIDINFKGTWTAELQQAFIEAADFLSKTIHSDVADVAYRGKVIDDIRIDAGLQQIDGEGGILGQAGATSIRNTGYLPATATMSFDSADANTFNALGLWKDIVLHEMIHSVGFSSTIWQYQNLISGAGTDTPVFTGAQTLAAYETLFGAAGASGVPLEQDGGAGTRDSHWDEETFGNELMTGYINPEGNYLSGMTIASLGDMGYDTSWETVA